MHNSMPFIIIVSLTALLMIGGGFALLLGIHTVNKQRILWPSMKKLFFLITDVVIGLIIGLFAFSERGVLSHLDGMVVIALFTHAYRDWEYLAGVNDIFCTNKPLFIINNAKLVGLLAILGVRIAQSWL